MAIGSAPHGSALPTWCATGDLGVAPVTHFPLHTLHSLMEVPCAACALGWAEHTSLRALCPHVAGSPPQGDSVLAYLVSAVSWPEHSPVYLGGDPAQL